MINSTFSLEDCARAMNLHRRVLSRYEDVAKDAVIAYEQAGMSDAAACFAFEKGLFVNAAKLYLSEGNLEKAIEAYEQGKTRNFFLTKEGEEFVQLLFQRGAEQAEGQKDYARAAKLLAKGKMYERAADMLVGSLDFELLHQRFLEGIDDDYHPDGYLQDKQNVVDLKIKLNNVLDWYTLSGRFDKAVAVAEKAHDLERAMEICVKGKLFEQGAMFAQRIGKIEDAIKLYEQGNLVERAATLAEKSSLFVLATTFYQTLGKYDGAVRCAENAKNIPMAISLCEQHGLFERGAKIALSVGRVGEAVELYEKGKLFEKGAILAEKEGLFQAAIQMYKNARMYDHAAICAEKDEQWDVAASLYGHLKNYLKSAECAEKAGQVNMAIQQYIYAHSYDNAMRIAEKELPSAVQRVQTLEVEYLFQKMDFLQAAKMAWKYDFLAYTVTALEQSENYLAAAEVAARHGELTRSFSLLQKQIDYCVGQSDYVGAACAAYRSGNKTRAVELYKKSDEFHENPAFFFTKRKLLPRIEQKVKEQGDILALLQ